MQFQTFESGSQYYFVVLSSPSARNTNGHELPKFARIKKWKLHFTHGLGFWSFKDIILGCKLSSLQTHVMKSILGFLFMLALSLNVNAQDPKSAATGVTYGAGTTADGAVHISQVSSNITEKEKFTGKVKGKVVSVCQEKGCWMKIAREEGDPVMVKFKDYGFFMPKDIVGKDVVLDGEATVKETSVKQLKHYAQDAGKSKEEIEKIKTSKKEIIFVAKGVLVL